MDRQSIRLELLATLTNRYEKDLRQFVFVPRPLMQMSTARAALAELRNDGYVEERTRGIVRLRPQGYMKYQKERLADDVRKKL